MPHYSNKRSFQFAAILFAAFLLLIVNREFGVADNGDFPRYMGGYASKPIDAVELLPRAHSEEWKFRYFEQPVIYWSPGVENSLSPWFTSASIFWTIGDKLGEIFFSPNIFNMRYVGLPFFLIQFFSLFYVVRRLAPSAFGPALMLCGSFWIMTDARITGFYNSFYAESVPILALFLVFCFFACKIFSASVDFTGVCREKFFALVVLLLLVASVFAKRQYLYFLVPTIIFACYYVLNGWNGSGKRKAFLLGFFFIALFGMVAVVTSTQRLENPEELSASRFTSYHALYYGLLPHSKDPVHLLDKLELPVESVSLIGKNAWNPASMKLVFEQSNIKIGTFVKAIAIEPTAFIGSILQNAKEVGNFAIPLGMVFGERPGYPPMLISGFSTVFTKLAGLGVFGIAISVALVLLVIPVGVAKEKRSESRILALILLTVMVSDVVISTFDGQQEARKHVFLASMAAALIFIHGAAILAGILGRDHQRAS